MKETNAADTNGVVFNIQRFSVHDGPGIRTTVFLKGCPLRCFWCQNPESQAKKPEIFLNKAACTLCCRCVTACPTGAAGLSVQSSTIDRTKCSGCGRCVQFCSAGCRILKGKYMTVHQVMQEVNRDRMFYENSGGGITLSGGEPAAQPGFALEILRESKNQGFHTVLDTCGYTPWSVMERLLMYTDLVLYDIKCVDPVKHHEGTGKYNRIILRNAVKIAKCKPMKVRVPIIPDFNDSVAEVRAMVHFVKTQLSGAEIDLLPYNKMGEFKYDRLGRVCVTLEELPEEFMEHLRRIVKMGPS